MAFIASKHETFTCPHCLHGFTNQTLSSDFDRYNDLPDPADHLGIEWTACTTCKKRIVFLVQSTVKGLHTAMPHRVYERRLVWPKGHSRKPLPPEVPADCAEDYNEACLVLDDSPKSAAALARRCLQHVLRQHLKVKPAELWAEIAELLDRKNLPSYIAENIDAIRHLGNFAAHPTKKIATGEIVAVEPGEAEWTLNILEELFDHVFVHPAKSAARRSALTAKLADSKKGAAIKTPPK